VQNKREEEEEEEGYHDGFDSKDMDDDDDVDVDDDAEFNTSLGRKVTIGKYGFTFH
jgi:hypothetical protein